MLATAPCTGADLLVCFHYGPGDPFVLRLFLGIEMAMAGFVRGLRMPPGALVAREKEKGKSSRMKISYLNVCLLELRRDSGTDALSEPGEGAFLERSAPRGLMGLSGACGVSDTRTLPRNSGKILKKSLPTVQLLALQAWLMNSLVR